MTPLKSQSYPKIAKVILAAFVLIAALGPSIMRSADKKTRSHITALSGRVQPKSDTKKDVTPSQGELERAAEVEKRSLDEAERLAEDRRIERLAEKFLAAQRADRIRLEKRLRNAEEKLEKQRAEEERKAQRELAKQLAEEERSIRIEVEQRIAKELEESEQELEERLLAEEQALVIELQEKVAKEKQLASEALLDRLEQEEESELQKMQTILKEKEEASKAKLLAQVAEEELKAKKKIEKKISEEARITRKEIDNRLNERERLAKAEMEKRVEQESQEALEELEKKIRSEEIARQSALKATLEQEEKEALAEMNKRLEAERTQLSESEQAVVKSNTREPAEINPKGESKEFVKSSNMRVRQATGFSQSVEEDGYKRPSLWGSFSRAPKRLLASIGGIGIPAKESYPGYLAFRAPPPLRFSDDISLTKRPPSPALPEFTILAPGRGSLTVETRLSDEEARKQALMNQIVFELEPHTIISGNIETTIPREIEERDRLLIEEPEESVVRPEEVLIFFENKRDGDSNTRTIVPFSPARPSQNAPAKSGATYNRE